MANHSSYPTFGRWTTTTTTTKKKKKNSLWDHHTWKLLILQLATRHLTNPLTNQTRKTSPLGHPNSRRQRTLRGAGSDSADVVRWDSTKNISPNYMGERWWKTRRQHQNKNKKALKNSSKVPIIITNCWEEKNGCIIYNLGAPNLPPSKKKRRRQGVFFENHQVQKSKQKTTCHFVRLAKVFMVKSKVNSDSTRIYGVRSPWRRMMGIKMKVI